MKDISVRLSKEFPEGFLRGLEDLRISFLCVCGHVRIPPFRVLRIMSPIEVPTLIYGVSGVLSVAMYLPQIHKLIKEPESRRGMSLFSWIGWSIGSLCTFFYALFVVNHIEMVAITGLNATFQLAVVALVFQQRVLDRLKNKNNIEEDIQAEDQPIYENPVQVIEMFRTKHS